MSISGPMDQAVRFLTAAQAAKHLGLSRRALDYLRMAGRGPKYRRFADCILYDREELDAWLRRQQRPSAIRVFSQLIARMRRRASASSRTSCSILVALPTIGKRLLFANVGLRRMAGRARALVIRGWHKRAR